MRKKFWVILLTALIFLSGAVLGISAVYRVDRVTVEAFVVSEEAKAEAETLREKLEEAYDKDSIFFANDSKVKEVLQDFPYFRITGFEKSYPNRLIVEITEDAEVYAVEKVAGQEYYLLGEDGMLLGVRDSHVNPLTGAENVIVKGLAFSDGADFTDDEQFPALLALCQALSKELGGIRSNVVSVEVFLRSPETIYRVTMREGVKLYFGTPAERTEEKVKVAVDEYMALSNEEKLSGRIVISEVGDRILTSYSAKDEFAS